tara:strand:- start:100 stop:333 length:234 start_codon:yes stop_codon:yes gene_type:complete
MELKVGDVVQIKPEHDEVFGGCLMVVTDPRAWGAQGYVSIPQSGGATVAYYRCSTENFVLTNGNAPYLLEGEGANDE